MKQGSLQRYHMHKQEREITDPDALLDILSEGQYVVLAMCRENEPYVVTLSYGHDRQAHALYFHTALQGLKLDVIEQNPRVCGTVIEDRGYIQGECAHAYRSLVLWGEMYVVDDVAEKKHGMEILTEHLESDPDPIRRKHLQKADAYERVAILRLDIQHMTGKQGR
jgi:nitroimidazol reductase NimA-like FMN-containing flavoprotein (pyridoxamine 5'-phosphate oxidase superfamily)